MIYILPHSISYSAKRFPDRIAFRCGQNTLTYRQINQRMNQVAGCLQNLGIQKGDRVGIYLNRSIETAIAIYGILQAGAVYVPIDPKNPTDRNRFLIEDCGISILITNPSQKRKIEKIIAHPSSLKTIIGLEKEAQLSIQTISWSQIFERSDQFILEFKILENDLAYIMYTSGSTGQPKGIMHTHYSGLSYARLTANLYGIDENDIIGNHAPIHFDICTLGYFTGPFVGACTVIASDAETIFPANLAQLIAKEVITIWYSVPLALIQMLQSGALEDKAIQLRWLLYAGEPFPPKYLRALMELWPQSRVSNIYGPTELNQCTYFNLPEIPQTNDPIPIGTVWGNTEYLIIDEEGELSPQGEQGELVVRSATQMLGYWQNPELTQQSFYHYQLSSGRTLAFYKTGDLVKEDKDGVLHFFGRKDFQVKIRGYRIELGAIESCLVTHAEVSEAAVYVLENTKDHLQLEAAVILKKRANISANDLSDYLKTKLPVYAIPEEIRILETFPRTSSGKIKRSAIKTIFQNENV